MWVIYGVRPLVSKSCTLPRLDDEIFSAVVLSFPLIQEGQLSVSGETNVHTTDEPLRGLSLSNKVWLGKLTALDMTPLG